ncbi:MAG: Crp/Fnr family transcriptional regulator [Cytophagales bacterium]|nr:MAG: Crp/Fnr family transcriptional regulator [Cytophagales bacterium]
MEKFFAFSEEYHISEGLETVLRKAAQKVIIAKNQLLLEEGRVCKYIYFLEKGFVRGFYYKDGKDVTTWFASENEFVTSMYSFVSQKPSIENIESLEESSLYAIHYDGLQEIYRTYPEFNLIGRILTEKYYIDLEERTLSLQFQTAKDRYTTLLAKEPYILQKASLGHIASYLGMSQETLSRIRAKV